MRRRCDQLRLASSLSTIGLPESLTTTPTTRIITLCRQTLLSAHWSPHFVDAVTRPVLQSLVASLMRTLLDYGCSTLAGSPARQLNRLSVASVINSAARLVYSARRSEHVSPLLRELHWLRVPERLPSRRSSLPLYERHSTTLSGQ